MASKKKGHRYYTKKRKKERLLKELEKSKGIVTTACLNCGFSRDSYYDWCEDDEEFKKKCVAIQEKSGDYVESRLLDLIEKGNDKAIIFYCKTKLKNRGYTERTETEANHTITHISIEPHEKIKTIEAEEVETKKIEKEKK